MKRQQVWSLQSSIPHRPTFVFLNFPEVFHLGVWWMEACDSPPKFPPPGRRTHTPTTPWEPWNQPTLNWHWLKSKQYMIFFWIDHSFEKFLGPGRRTHIPTTFGSLHCFVSVFFRAVWSRWSWCWVTFLYVLVFIFVLLVLVKDFLIYVSVFVFVCSPYTVWSVWSWCWVAFVYVLV